MPVSTTCQCSVQDLPTTPGCSLRKMPGHQQAFLGNMLGGGLAGVRLADWIPGPVPDNRYCLTEAEWVSLIAYTKPGPACLNGAALNACLRSGNPSPDMENCRDTLKDALARLPAGPSCVSRRTTLPQTVLHQYRKGAVVEDAGFTSASVFAVAAWQGPHRFFIASRTGKRISQYSAVANRWEVLFEPETSFRVTCRRDLKGNCVDFELQEV